MTADQAPVPLDAPLSDAEAEECERVTESERARVALNDAMWMWTHPVSHEDAEGDLRDLILSAFLAGWKAGFDYGTNAALRAADRENAI